MGYVKGLSAGDKAPSEINVVIEIPMGSNVKYEVDKESGVIKVDRILYTSMSYPFNYGFVPGTLEEDGDPLDALVISYDPLLPGSLVRAKPIGLLVMEDEEGPDSKLICVPVPKVDPRFEGVKDVGDLPQALKDRIRHFFEHYKELEPGKWVKVKDWRGAEEAEKKVAEAIKRFKSR